jgi:hypothetical protein
MNTITQCPWCDESLDEPVDTETASAESFCPHCSAPLFMAPSRRKQPPATDSPIAAEAIQADPTKDPSRRRPELKGVRSTASVPCWQCFEPNQQVASTCHRCGAPIPPPAVEDTGVISVPACGAAAGATARRRIEVKAWILVVLGIVLLALIIQLVVLVW